MREIHGFIKGPKMSEIERKDKTFFLKRLMGVVLCLLATVSLYYFFRGNYFRAGILYLLIGLLSPLTVLPYCILFLFIGLMFISVAYKKFAMLLIIGLIMVIIAFFDLLSILRIMESKKHYTGDKPDLEKFWRFMKEEELTYKLWKKFKRRCWESDEVKEE